MSVVDLDPVILTTEARKCRRLASTLQSPDDVAMLERLALEYEALASEAQNAKSARGDWRTVAR